MAEVVASMLTGLGEVIDMIDDKIIPISVD